MLSKRLYADTTAMLHVSRRLAVSIWRMQLVAAALSLSLSVPSSQLHAAEREATNSTQSRSSLLKLPGFLRRGAGTKAKEAAESASTNRFLARSRQLLSDARRLASGGHTEAALDLARRASSVITAAERTTSVRWPSSEQHPDAYVAELEAQLKELRRPSRSSLPASGLTKPLQSALRPAQSLQGQPVPGSEESTHSRELFLSEAVEIPPASTEPSLDRDTQGASSAPSSELLLDWGDRRTAAGVVFADADQTALVDASVEHVAGADVPDKTETAPATVDESELLFRQLEKLETWTAFEEDEQESETLLPGKKSPEQFEEPAWSTAVVGEGETSPIASPLLIDPAGAIDDHRVEPIPTRAPEVGTANPSGSPTVTIPIVPETPKSKLEDERDASGSDSPLPRVEQTHKGTPWLLPESATPTEAVGEPASTVVNEQTSAQQELWQLATVQLIATFFGVLLAIAAFLVIRALAAKLFGTGFGITVQLGDAPPVLPVEASADAPSTGGVPFGETAPFNETAAVAPVKRAGGVIEPESFPFKLIGADGTPADEQQTAKQADLEREESILKTVFEQNVELQNQLDENNENAA